MYGSIRTPIKAANPPTIVGKIISVKLPKRSPTTNIKNTAIAAVIIVLIKSPTPTSVHTPSLNCATPLPTNAELATTAVANGVRLKRIAIKAPTRSGTVNCILSTTCNMVSNIGYFGERTLNSSPKIAFGIRPATIAIATPDNTLLINCFGLIFIIAAPPKL